LAQIAANVRSPRIKLPMDIPPRRIAATGIACGHSATRPIASTNFNQRLSAGWIPG